MPNVPCLTPRAFSGDNISGSIREGLWAAGDDDITAVFVELSCTRRPSPLHRPLLQERQPPEKIYTMIHSMTPCHRLSQPRQQRQSREELQRSSSSSRLPKKNGKCRHDAQEIQPQIRNLVRYVRSTDRSVARHYHQYNQVCNWTLLLRLLSPPMLCSPNTHRKLR